MSVVCGAGERGWQQWQRWQGGGPPATAAGFGRSRERTARSGRAPQ